jgi:N-acetylmuramoyl-L-alanine amidase
VILLIKKRNTILMIAVIVLCTVITAACSDKRGVEITTFSTTRISDTQRKGNDTQITSSHDIDSLTTETPQTSTIKHTTTVATYPKPTPETNANNNNSSTNQTNYSENDLYWLSRIIHAEASGEPFDGKVAVGNVVLNRVRSKNYPNTVYGVIFDKKHGVQYQPTINGAIYNSPSSESMKAAKAAVNGNNNVGKSMFFFNPKKSTSNWISKNRTYYTTIGNHKFYL